MKLTCICGKSYWPKQAWAHEKCKEINKPAIFAWAPRTDVLNGINGPVSLGAYTPGCGAPVATAEDLAQPVTVTVTRQAKGGRRDKKAYNEYMKDYMKTYRAR